MMDPVRPWFRPRRPKGFRFQLG